MNNRAIVRGIIIETRNILYKPLHYTQWLLFITLAAIMYLRILTRKSDDARNIKISYLL